MSRKIEDWRGLQRQLGAWNEKTFPTQTLLAKIKHLEREVQELLKNPRDRAELADCQLLLLEISRMGGTDFAQLFDACVSKFRINEMRKWGPADADGVHQHIKDPA